MHAATPSHSPEPKPSHTPTTIRMPRNPTSRPMIRSTVGCSSGNASRITARVVSGVLALMMPARTDEICVSPRANSVNGMLFRSMATMKR